MRVFVCLILSLIASCSILELANDTLSDEERSFVINETRKLIYSSELELSAEELENVTKNEPNSFGVYFIPKPVAQYHLVWDLSSSKKVIVHGIGDIFQLEGAKIEIDVHAQ